MAFPEYLTVDDPARTAAEHVVEWLTDPVARGLVVERLEGIAHDVDHGGSAERAAEAVLAIAAGRPVVAVHDQRAHPAAKAA